MAELPLLAAAEAQQLLVEWDGAVAAASGWVSVAERFAAQVEQTPANVALSFGGSEVTYRDLGAELELRLAGRLQRLGASCGMRVAVCLERSPALVSGLLGVLASGAAFVPLESDASSGAVSELVEDSGATVLVTREAIARRLPRHGAEIVLVEDDATRPAAGRKDDATRPAAGRKEDAAAARPEPGDPA